MIVFPRTSVENRLMLAWLESRVADAGMLKDAQAIGVARAGAWAAMAAFNCWRPGASVDITFAADTPRWASRDHVAGILSYPFGQLQVRRLQAITREDNDRARRFLEGLGFWREGWLNDFFAEGARGALYCMTRRWWMESKWHGQEHAVAAARA